MAAADRENFPKRLRNDDIRRGPEVQAARAWTPPTGVLGRLTDLARVRSRALELGLPALEARAAVVPDPASFRDALLRPTVAVIAEIKRRSPSKGAINATLDAPTRARAYAAGGAAALSVLTEPSEFGGDIADLVSVREAVSIPLLRKDFIVSTSQIVEARATGASAVLLIARALAPDELGALAHAARVQGLDSLIEVRDEWELERALAAGASVVGVNTRNLETLLIDPAVGLRLVPSIPATIPAIYESGVQAVADVQAASDAGADAVLVGSVLSASVDPEAAVRALAQVPRRGRRG
jgi:indole-3-glycerol phosphate synthase